MQINRSYGNGEWVSNVQFLVKMMIMLQVQLAMRVASCL